MRQKCCKCVDVRLYVSQANEWHELSPGGTLPSSRGNLAAVWSPTADGIYAFGGKDESHGLRVCQFVF